MNRPRRFLVAVMHYEYLSRLRISETVDSTVERTTTSALVEQGQQHLGIDVKPVHPIERTKTNA